MAQANPSAGHPTGTKPKRTLGRQALFLYLAISVLLIVLIWVDNVSEDEPSLPTYYRDSFQLDPGHYATVTAEAAEFGIDMTATPQPPATQMP